MRHWNELHGHFLTREEVAEHLGVPEAVVADMPELVRFGGLMSQETYPMAQFDSSWSPTPGIAEASAAVGAMMSSRDFAAFATTPVAALGGRTPIAWLQGGGSVDQVVRVAAA